MQKDSVVISGKELFSVRSAAEETGYTRDYIGQLARGGKIPAQRVGKAWFVDLEALKAYKDQASQYVPTPPPVPQRDSMESIVGLDGKEYISAKRASEISQYNADYITSMARDGKLLAQQIAGRWFVEKSGLLAHKKESDAQLAVMHSRTTGFVRPEALQSIAKSVPKSPKMSYFTEENDLLPLLVEKKSAAQAPSQQPRINVVDLSHAHTPQSTSPEVQNRLTTMKNQRSIQIRGGMQLLAISASVLVLVMAGIFGLSAVGSSQFAAASKIISDANFSGALEQLERLLGADVSYEKTK